MKKNLFPKIKEPTPEEFLERNKNIEDEKRKFYFTATKKMLEAKLGHVVSNLEVMKHQRWLEKENLKKLTARTVCPLTLVSWTNMIRPTVDMLNTQDVQVNLHLTQLETNLWFIGLMIIRDKKILKSYHFSKEEAWKEIELEILDLVKTKSL